MLRSLRIQHFKSIYEAELKFGRANLFIGANGAGKSNVLEAIGVLASALSKGLEPTDLDDRGIRLSLPTMFKSAFRKTDLPRTFRLEATFEHGRYECSIRAGLKRTALEFHSEALYDGNTKVFGRGPNGVYISPTAIPQTFIDVSLIDPSRGLWDILSPFAKISDELRLEIDDVSAYSIYAPQTAVMRGLAIDARVKTPLGLTGSGLATAFGDAVVDKDLSPQERQRVNKIMSIIWQPGWADQIRVGGFDPLIVPSQVKSDGALLYIRDRFMKTNRNYLSAFDASEGTLYLIFVATLLSHVDAPKVFALDNIDGTLNPQLVRRLADTLVEVCCADQRIGGAKAHNQQTFVTSHHPSSLDSFDLFSPEQAVFVGRRDEHADQARGSTKFDRVLPPEGVTRDEWADRSGGKNMSTLLLEGLIPGALR